MASKKKKSTNAKIYVLVVALILFLLILGGIRVMLTSGVKIESRVAEIEKYQAAHSKHKVAAWVRVPGTNIDYPVLDDIQAVAVEASENMDYLWKNGKLEKLNRINYIMGHNIMNLSSNPKITDKDHVRFEQLMSFTYLDFAKENQYVQFTIDGKDYLFKIFSVSYPDTFNVDSYNLEKYDDSDVKRYIEKSKERSIYDYDIDVNEKDTVISLITCTRMFLNERDFVVDARLVRENESTGKYKVEKNKNYDVVEEMMKGGKTTNEEM